MGWLQLLDNIANDSSSTLHQELSCLKVCICASCAAHQISYASLGEGSVFTRKWLDQMAMDRPEDHEEPVGYGSQRLFDRGVGVDMDIKTDQFAASKIYVLGSKRPACPVVAM